MTKGQCSISDCDSQVVGRGWCRKHYSRWSRHGTTDKPMGIAARWHRVDDSQGPESCWEWSGTTRKGYGVFIENGTPVAVHRAAYEWLVGPIPDGLILRHTCDNPRCANPAHLTPGTKRQNSGDMMTRGRHQRSLADACSKGHRYAEHPPYINPKGHRRCRVCARAATSRYRG